jgi:hypothetical protein
MADDVVGLNRLRRARGVDKRDPLEPLARERHPAARDIAPRERQRVEDDERDDAGVRVDVTAERGQGVVNGAVAHGERALVALDREPVRLVQVAAADQVVELVEEHRLPCFLERRRLRPSLRAQDRTELLRRRERRLGAPVQLLERNPRRVAAGEDRVEVATELR